MVVSSQPRRQRHKRYNARAEVWCNRCQQFRHADHFKRHPSRPHTYWSYCKDCTRIIDRERYARKTSTLEGAERVLAARYERKKRYQRRDRADRFKFLAESVDLLMRRGFTQADICRLTGISTGPFYAWRKREHMPSRNALRRIGIVVEATIHYPISDRRAKNNRYPHPDTDVIRQRIQDDLDRYPMRDSWKNRRKQATP